MSAADIPIPDLTIPHDETPCPFCGSRKAYANLDGGVWFGVCAECFSASGPGADTPEEAMAQWNHRAGGMDEPTPKKEKAAPKKTAGAPSAAGEEPTETSPENAKAKSRSRRAPGSTGDVAARKSRPPRPRKQAPKDAESGKEGGAE